MIRRPFFRGPVDRILLGLGVGIAVALVFGLGYLTGQVHKKIAFERECRGFRAECVEAQVRGWQVVRTGR